ncbi:MULTISPECIES: hypothetical protein [unclassified Pantoea]|uniref:hypothetical protein n=1 Tax=unclassified Pantoea TaxID=2630326 RepID=UPI00351CF89E
MFKTYAYPWNAPREAIASPYPTYQEQRSRDQMIAALARAYELLEKQPKLIQYDVKRRASELEKTLGIARANAYLTKTFVERTLPRVECVSYPVRVFQLGEDDVAVGYDLFRRDLNAYHKCMQSGNWGGIEEITRPDWAKRKDYA